MTCGQTPDMCVLAQPTKSQQFQSFRYLNVRKMTGRCSSVRTKKGGSARRSYSRFA